MKVGVLALQGAVSEHVSFTKTAMEKLGISGEVSEVRTRAGLEGLDAIILPGGESTTLSLLLEEGNMFEALAQVPKIFGTCAGAILLAKEILGAKNGQKSLGLMDMKISRNAYGRQLDSFEAPLKTSIGELEGVFIRAPAIEDAGSAEVLATHEGKPVAARQGNHLATTFHPELSGSTIFHEYFLKL